MNTACQRHFLPVLLLLATACAPASHLRQLREGRPRRA